VQSPSRLGVIVLKLDGRTGRERWRRLFGATDGFDAGAPDVTLGAGGDVLVSAILGKGILVARLEAATGADVWQRPIPQSSIEFFGTAIAADADGNPVMVTAAANPGSGSDLAIRKVSGDTGGEDICGDGIRASSEACDDGNRVDGDCCGATCVVEQTPVCGGPDGPGPDDPDDPALACAGERVPRRITRGISKAERLLASADEAPKPDRVVKRAKRTLGKTSRMIERAAEPRRKKPARITATCAASLRGVVVSLQASASAGTS
jgi:cysteine-rich repeat protein